MSKSTKFRKVMNGVFALCAVSMLSACKEDDIAQCLKQATGINGDIGIHENGVSMEYWFTDTPHDRYIEYYVFTEKPGLSTYIEKGFRLRERQGKSTTTLHFEESHWYDGGREEPQRSIIRAITRCIKQVLPERADKF